jgi:hypothetical protein
LVVHLKTTDRAKAPHRQQAQRDQLPRDCRLDTWALVRLWALLAGSLGVLTPP